MLAQEQRPPESGDGGGERRGDAPGSPCVRHRKPAPPEHASVCKAPKAPKVGQLRPAHAVRSMSFAPAAAVAARAREHTTTRPAQRLFKRHRLNL